MTTISKETSAAAPSGQNGFSLISNNKLLQLYSTMLKCRMIEERVRVLFKQDRFISSYSAIKAQEAAAVGVAIDLLPEDTICPSHRDLIPSFIQGIPLDELFRQFSARAAAKVRPSKARALAQFKIANGVALVNKINKNGKIAVSFIDAETTSPGSCHKALKFAGDKALPIIFVQLDYLSKESAAPKLSANGTKLKTPSYGFPSIVVDGADVVAVYRVACEAIVHARKGNGPTLVECRTGGPEHDCILNMEKYLTRKGLYSDEYRAQVTANFSSVLDEAIGRGSMIK